MFFICAVMVLSWKGLFPKTLCSRLPMNILNVQETWLAIRSILINIFLVSSFSCLFIYLNKSCKSYIYVSNFRGI